MHRLPMRSTLQRVCPQCGSVGTGLLCPVDSFATVPMEAKELVDLAPGTTLLGRFVLGATSEHDGAVTYYQGRAGETAVRIAVVPLAAGGTDATSDGVRMLATAQALGRIHHPNIARIVACGLTEGGALAIVSEHVAGLTLEDVIAKGPVASERAMEIGLALLAALEAAHARGAVHHDLAPARVRFAADGRVVVTDTGLADLLRGPDAQFDEGLMLARGAAYRAPEQARARAVTRHADIYSVGAILFETLTGKTLGAANAAWQANAGAMRSAVPVAVSSPLPFVVDKKFEAAASPIALPASDQRGEPGSAPMALPTSGGSGLHLLKASIAEPPLAEFVARCLEKKPWNRYDTATLAREALEAAREAIEKASPIGQTRLGNLEWDAPQSESPTRESARPDPALSGLLDVGTWPATQKDATRPTLAIQDIEPVAPIARPVVRYVRPRRQGWWLVAGALALVASAVGVTMWVMSDEGGRRESVGLEQRAVQTREDVDRAAAERAVADEQARHDAEIALKAAAKARADELARAEASRIAREAEEAAKAAALAKAVAEAPLTLDAVGPEDGDGKLAVARTPAEIKAAGAKALAAAKAAEAKARADAKALALKAQADAQAAEARVRADQIADRKAKREAEANAKREAEARAREVEARRVADAKAKRVAAAQARVEADTKARVDAETKAVKAPVEASKTEPRQQKTWSEKRAEEVAAAEAQVRIKAEAGAKARVERERKEAEAKKAEAEARAARDAAWKKKVEAVEREQKLLADKKTAEIEARKAARLAAEAKKVEAEKLAKAAKTAKADQPGEGNAPDDPSLYRALLSTVPAGASVLVDGALVGRTPLTLTWKPGAVKHVWVMLEGHTPTGFDVGDAQHTKMLRLELVPSTPEKPVQDDPPSEDP